MAKHPVVNQYGMRVGTYDDGPDYTPAIVGSLWLLLLAVILFPYGMYLLSRWEARTLARMWNTSDRTKFWLAAAALFWWTAPILQFSLLLGEWNQAPQPRRYLAYATLGLIALGLLMLAFD